ncbi:hypothetical protein DFQ30_003220 [Apophysomyces sp. BC1015]|nr:hypothetical protein DFQ30_003220 [Apophysomyces sp. BC1015]
MSTSHKSPAPSISPQNASRLEAASDRSAIGPIHQLFFSQSHSQYPRLTHELLEKKNKLEHDLYNVSYLNDSNQHQELQSDTKYYPKKRNIPSSNESNASASSIQYHAPASSLSIGRIEKADISSNRSRVSHNYSEQNAFPKHRSLATEQPLDNLSAQQKIRQLLKLSKGSIWKSGTPHSTLWSLPLPDIAALVERVIDVRNCEPDQTRWTADELIGLSQYSRVLCMQQFHDYEERSREPSVAQLSFKASRTPTIIEETEQDEFLSLPTSDETQSLSEVSSQNLAVGQKRRTLGSLANIFPFVADIQPNESRYHVHFQPEIATSSETDPELGLSSEATDQNNHWPSEDDSHFKLNTARHVIDPAKRAFRRMSRTFGVTMSDSTIPPSIASAAPEKVPQIRFRGWSLRCFSPTSTARLFLWNIIASR